jgi:hypothetical protein
MKIKICESHIKIYEYLRRKVDKLDIKVINIKYNAIGDAVRLSYPQVAKCMIELVKHGCIKKIQDGKGRRVGGSEYLVNTGFKAFKKRVTKVKVYETKYKVTILDLKKEVRSNERGAN